MKWILIALAVVAAVVAVIAAIGATLPRDHVATRSLAVRRPPEEVWPAIMQATAASGVPVDVVESDPPRRQVTRVKDTEKNFGGTWTITITPSPGDRAAALKGLQLLAKASQARMRVHGRGARGEEDV